MSNGILLSGSRSEMCSPTAIVPVPPTAVSKSGSMRYIRSRKSPEFAFAPKPLSGIAQYSPPPASRTAEKPCTGWPRERRRDAVDRRGAERRARRRAVGVRLGGQHGAADELRRDELVVLGPRRPTRGRERGGRRVRTRAWACWVLLEGDGRAARTLGSRARRGRERSVTRPYPNEPPGARSMRDVALAARQRPAPRSVAGELVAAVEQQQRQAARLVEPLRRRAVAARGPARQRPADAVVDDDDVQRPKRELELLAEVVAIGHALHGTRHGRSA